jgi:hypothetical protein
LLLEGLTATHASHEPDLRKRWNAPQGEFWLKSRAWEGGGHIGNRRAQAHAYYDLVKRARAPVVDPAPPLRLCEVGLNGGHSALILLAAAGRGSSLQMFDYMRYSYSARAAKVIDALFPGGMRIWQGNSRQTLPAFLQRTSGGACDFFSVDGDHRYPGAKADLIDAVAATRAGGTIVMDDMARGTGARRAFDEVASLNLTDVNCREHVRVHVSTLHRLDRTHGLVFNTSWCAGQVLGHA